MQKEPITVNKTPYAVVKKVKIMKRSFKKKKGK